jgi:hypothetical protein
MNDSQWDAKLKSFLKKTGDDFKRFGTDVKEEAQKLLTEVQDPARQQKLRDGLKDVGVWAKKTAEEVATLVETGVKKAEGAIGKAGEKANDFLVKPVGGEEPAPRAAPQKAAAPPAPTPPSPPPEMDEAPAPAPKKTVGKGAPKKKPAAKKSGAKKTIGKKGTTPES